MAFLTLAEIWHQIKSYFFLPLILLGGGVTGLLQNIDGYYYYPSFANPRDKIKMAREMEWSDGDLFLSTFPKSGTHFALLTSLLVLYKGEFPLKSDLHAHCCAPEFSEASKCRTLEVVGVGVRVRVSGLISS
jgi:calcineurin-like phosphoesterase family protein